jgi:hypothetical protein
MTINSKHRIIKDKVTLPIIITVLPFLGYLCAYAYEYSYFQYYNIPFEYIKITINDVLLFIILVLGTIGSMYWISNIIYATLSLIPWKSHLTKPLIIRVGVTIILISFLLVLEVSSSVVTILFSVLWINYIFPLLLAIPKDGKMLFIQRYDHQIRNTEKDQIPFALSKKYNHQILTLVYFIIFLVSISVMAGKATAKFKTRFFTLGNDTTSVVIKVADSELIMCKTKEIRAQAVKQWFIINKTSQDTLHLLNYYLER